ncbi:purine nucleoside phosphorylase YfiH [Oceanimonas pelagia]|uniref:Purine nucleoside phosphorylase n=1 Tax=Oceanimonas pelagia TaxID=3028314 RepID=A0AA50KN50_9GAMM|nr:purine nucleoside phosphorylase YfiH [Oceanimonas pelagia]WMC10010.1 purine nucleoside phosphorylase YfiH [Oceanimonas pelagia]
MDLILPDWPAPAHVCAAQSTRTGGVSEAPWHSLNLGTHVGDHVTSVRTNRERLAACLNLPSEPVWLEQVHGIRVLTLPAENDNLTADAVVSRTPGQVCAVMTADCLPVLFCDEAGTVVAAAHAGWRGLAAGVLEATLLEMKVDPETVLAWLGPAIGPKAFEVGGEVREAFIGHSGLAEEAFEPQGDKWLADIYHLARLRLAAAGVHHIYGGEYCTLSEPGRFFSYRRDGQTGRMASLIWLD